MAFTNPADGAALLNEVHGELTKGNLHSGVRRLREELGRLRNELSTQDWAAFCKSTLPGHPLREMFRGNSLTEQRFPPSEWEGGLSYFEAVRSRRKAIASELREIIDENKNARILSLGRSHLAETGFQQVRCEGGNISRNTGSTRFDFIYALDFFDTLVAGKAKGLIPRLVAMLKPNGRLLIANLPPETPEASYLEAFLDYWPHYRSEEELAELTARVPEQQIGSQCVFRDGGGRTVFLEIQKSTHQ